MTEKMKKKLSEDSMTFLADGALWYLKNMWHDAKEVPSEGAYFIALKPSGRCIVGDFNSSYTNPENGRTAFSIFTKKVNATTTATIARIEKWAYIEDLKPDVKEERL